jgi:hypothetical protein
MVLVRERTIQPTIIWDRRIFSEQIIFVDEKTAGIPHNEDIQYIILTCKKKTGNILNYYIKQWPNNSMEHSVIFLLIN